MTAMMGRKNEDRTEAIEGKRKKRQENLEKKFIGKFTVKDRKDIVKKDKEDNMQVNGDFEEKRAMERGEKAELKASWVINKDKWYEHKKTRKFQEDKRVF